MTLERDIVRWAGGKMLRLFWQCKHHRRAGAEKSQPLPSSKPSWELFMASVSLHYVHTWIRRRNRRGRSFLGIIGNKVDQFCGQATGSLRQSMQFVMLSQTPPNYDSLKYKEERQRSHELLKISKNSTHQTLYYPLGERMHWPTAAADASLLAEEHTHKHTHKQQGLQWSKDHMGCRQSPSWSKNNSIITLSFLLDFRHCLSCRRSLWNISSSPL